MNAAIQDAANRGWKLAFAAARPGNGPLLDSYDLERRPVARQVLAMTQLAFWAEDRVGHWPEQNHPRLPHGRRRIGQLGTMDSGRGDGACREEPGGGHRRLRGRPWALVWVVIAALYVGGVAVIGHRWVLFWACAGVVALSIPAGKIIAIMGEAVAAGRGACDSPQYRGD